MDFKQDNTKYCCFLCKWDSRDKDSHYKIKEWPARENFEPGKDNVKPLVDPIKIILPSLHIKLGLMKYFVKAKDGEGFKYLKQIFPKISNAKIKEGIFVGPQIRKLQKDKNFESVLTCMEKQTWNACV